MKFLFALFVICLTVFSYSAAQQYFFSGQFPAANGGVARDPRQNRGPVVFPPSPPDAIDETSGVVVGASGFGFVPPNQPTGPRYYTPTALQVPDPAAYVAYHYFTSPYTSRFSFF